MSLPPISIFAAFRFLAGKRTLGRLASGFYNKFSIKEDFKRPPEPPHLDTGDQGQLPQFIGHRLVAFVELENEIDAVKEHS
jgi:hypothetical protein